MNLKTYAFYIVVAVAALLYFGGRYIYFMPRYGSGEKAPDFTATLIDGAPFTLSELQGSYVLIDFWGSWCGPCRIENPDIVDLHERFGGKNFEIVSIGVERSERNWKRAIESDGLVWKYHIGQFDQFDSPIPEAFGVREIPTKFLVGPDGHILEVNPTVSAIEEVLTENS